MSPDLVAGAVESEEALVADLGAARQGVGVYVASRGPVLSYLAALRAVTLGERPLIVGGQEAGRFDPLGSRPAAARLLATAKYHGEELAGYLDTLHGWAGGAMVPYVGYVLPELAKARDLLAAIPEDGPASAEQASALSAAIAVAATYTSVLGYAATTMRLGVIDFLGHLVADVGAFSAGETAVAEIKRQVAADCQAAALPLLPYPFTSGLGQAILEMGRAKLAELDGLARSLDQALAGHREMGTGISALASAVTTIQAKYGAAQKAVSRASRADLPQVIRKLEPAKAIQFWQDFLQFLANSAL